VSSFSRINLTTTSSRLTAISEILFVLNQIPPRTSSRANELCMPTCEVCENEYDKAFEVVVAGERHIFDSFECAIHALAPVCPHCSCRIVGHGVEADGKIFCCVHCARASGTTQLKDRI
jgi:hypothetical protein